MVARFPAESEEYEAGNSDAEDGYARRFRNVRNERAIRKLHHISDGNQAEAPVHFKDSDCSRYYDIAGGFAEVQRWYWGYLSHKVAVDKLTGGNTLHLECHNVFRV